MNNTLKTIVWTTTAIAVVSLGVAAVLFFATGMGETWKRGNGTAVDERRAFDMGEIGEIHVRTSSTDVRIAPSRGDTVEMHLHGTVYAGQTDAVPALTVEQNGDVLEITTARRDGKRWALGFFAGKLILEIHIPEQYRGSLTAKTSSGDVQINDQNLSELSIETSSGTVQLGKIQAMKIAIESSSGDITLRYGEFSSEVEVRSSSGDVELYLTEAAEFQVEARASSGDIDCAFPVTLSNADSEIRKNGLYGTVGAGTYRVRVNTSSGDITIRP